MQLEIVSPTSKTQYQISWIELNTMTGNYVIQTGHVPTILQLTHQSPISFALTSGAIQTITPQAGIAHITREQVMLLIND